MSLTLHPDIVLLVLDTQRADRLSCYGCPVETSPHLDAFSAEATRFAHAVTPAQWTIPAHASMFTGLYPSQHATVQMDSVLPTTLPTLAERLQDAGYLTAGFSNNPYVGVLNNGLRRGFQSFSNYGGLLTPRPHRAAEQLSRQRASVKRAVARLLSRVQHTIARSPTANSLLFSWPVLSLRQAALGMKGNLKGDTEQTLTDAARLLIEQRGAVPDQPVFCFINLMGAHVPFKPPRWAIQRFAPRVRLNAATPLFLWQLDVQVHRRLGPLPDLLDPERKVVLDGLYNAEVATQDRQIGCFFDRLGTAGTFDRTLLIVASDHGELLGEKRLLGHAFTAYEELSRVPLLIRDPLGNLPRGATVTACVSTRRLFHTVLATAGIATSAEETLSLAHTGADDPDRGIVFAEAEPLQMAMHLAERRQPGLLRALGYDRPHVAVYNGVYKLIAIGERQVELYAVRSDPLENRDLHQVLPGEVERLRAYLQNHVQQTSAATAGVTQLEDDPMLRERLRALGYLE